MEVIANRTRRKFLSAQLFPAPFRWGKHEIVHQLEIAHSVVVVCAPVSSAISQAMMGWLGLVEYALIWPPVDRILGEHGGRFLEQLEGASTEKGIKGKGKRERGVF